MGSVLADFTAYVVMETRETTDPVEARVLLSNGEMVVVFPDDERESIPTKKIIDVNVGSVPMFVDPMPGTPITIAYRHRLENTTAVISPDEETATKFRQVLFKALLNGTYVTLQHPAKVGGRVMDTPFTGGILSVGAGEVTIDTNEGPVAIALNRVIDYTRQNRTIENEDRPVIVVKHMNDGESFTTVAATDSKRTMSLLGRYLQRQYQKVVASLNQISLSDAETEALTTIYSVKGMDVSLPSVLETHPNTVKRMLHALHQKGLIESQDGKPVLTAKGQIVVNKYLERINA